MTGTPEAASIVRRAARDRRGSLTITIGTGCCESTAPFLYEDFWVGPDQEQVGEVAGVPVFAPEYLRRLYQGDDGVMIDVVEGVLLESFSIETEYGVRLMLRNLEGQPVPGQEPEAAGAGKVVVPAEVSALRPRGEVQIPENLRRLRMR
ncbi:MAG: DUF779 domain-containing protein [Acidimicrobiia bacterium]|nr:DUF779 domain-containing protein [Acidimicrobiia bacterium]